MISKLIAIVCCAFTIMSCVAMQNIMEDRSDDILIQRMQITIGYRPEASQKLLIQLANCWYADPKKRNAEITIALSDIWHYRKKIWQENWREGFEICGDALMFIGYFDALSDGEIYTDPSIKKYEWEMLKLTGDYTPSENEDLEEIS